MEQAQLLANFGEEASPEERAVERRLPLTYAQFLARFDESAHAEWVNGEAILFMPPTIRHQLIVVFLLTLISDFVKLFDLGIALTAPCEMRLSVTNSSREPAIMFLTKGNYSRLDENRINGPADLVVEVVSKASVARDRTDKFYEYQANGVTEYWVIDPRSSVARADFWVLDNEGSYQPVPVDASGTYHSTVLPNFNLNVTSLLTDESLDHFQALIEMVGLETINRMRGR